MIIWVLGSWGQTSGLLQHQSITALGEAEGREQTKVLGVLAEKIFQLWMRSNSSYKWIVVCWRQSNNTRLNWDNVTSYDKESIAVIEDLEVETVRIHISGPTSLQKILLVKEGNIYDLEMWASSTTSPWRQSAIELQKKNQDGNFQENQWCKGNGLWEIKWSLSYLNSQNSHIKRNRQEWVFKTPFKHGTKILNYFIRRKGKSNEKIRRDGNVGGR